MSLRQDDAVWTQLTESLIGRFGGAVIETSTRAAAESRFVAETKRARATWMALAPASRHRAVGTLILTASATHVAMVLPHYPPGAWWLILPALAGAFGVTLIALSLLASRAGAAE